MVSTIRRVAVLTGGTDGPGMNAAIRAAVRSSLEVGWSVLGVRHGFSGLLRGDYVPLDSRSVSHRIDKGGTLLGTSQQESLATAAKVRQALRSLNEERVDALVSIGGDVSARGGVALGDAGFPVTLIPATIENDLWGTDLAVGVDTAINTAMDVIDRIKDTASSQQQAFVVETAGARSGYLALMVAIVAGAEIACLPESSPSLEDIAREVSSAYVRGKEHCIVVVAEGAHPDARAIQQYLVERSQETGFEAHLTMLGHIQRGGSPTAKDRYLATLLGTRAVQALAEGERGVMAGLVSGGVALIPLRDVVSRRPEIDPMYVELADTLAR